MRLRRQVLFFLVAILVPCVVLAALSLRMISQERELAGRRRTDERRRLADQMRKDLLARLERIKLDELSLPVKARNGYRNSSVALAGAIEGGRLVLPWEDERAAARFRDFLGRSGFEAKIREGERDEFAAGQAGKAIQHYREAMRAAGNPAQAAYARLLTARALDKSGRGGEALPLFRALLKASDVADEDGVPLRLYAAERLLQAGLDTEGVLKIAQWAAARPGLPPAGFYILSTMTEKLTRMGADPDAREAARALNAKVRSEVRTIDQALALQTDFPKLNLPGNASEPVWVPYGEETWLVGRTEAALLAVRARDVLAAVEDLWNRSKQAAGVRFLTRLEGGGEFLGNTFPGMKVVFDLREDDAALKHGELQRLFFYAALLFVLGATMFGAYLLWRDLHRELKLAELRSQFVSSVSHELKTPLTAIRMFAETLQMGRSPDPRTQDEYLETIVNESERLSRLVDDVLHFSKIERGKKLYQFRTVYVSEVVSAAARTLQYPLSQQGFNLKVDIDDDLPPLRADRDALEQAVLNLLSNAMKFSGDSREIELELARRNGEAVISVCDHGIGIPAEEHKRIFDKFYRVPTRENQLIPGTGLGLALVANIVRAHNGRVEVRSAPGEGSTFSIFLPMEAQL